MNKKFKMPTKGQIDVWKKEHGVLHKLTVKVPGHKDAVCIVRAPKVADISQSATLGNGDDFKIGFIQLKNCWLDGDERILNRLSFQKAAAEQMGRIFEVYPWSVESIDVTAELLEKLKTQGTDAAVISKISEEGVLRKITIVVGSVPVIKDGEDLRKTIEATFRCPDLEVKEKADLGGEFLDKGAVYVNECFLFGDPRFTNHSDEHIAFASYLAGNSLIEQLTVEVEKM